MRVCDATSLDVIDVASRQLDVLRIHFFRATLAELSVFKADFAAPH